MEMFEGYVRSEEKTYDLARALWNAAYKEPTQRLGQLLINLAGGRDLWNIRDEEWIRLLNKVGEANGERL